MNIWTLDSMVDTVEGIIQAWFTAQRQPNVGGPVLRAVAHARRRARGAESMR